MSLTEFLESRGFCEFEGYSQEVKGQVEDLIQLTQAPVKTVMEIGFNAGHSAEVFLENNKDLNLVSFDLGSHSYGAAAKEYIDSTYPGRHTIVWGDSTVTVPEYINENPGKTFDFIFIDGGHEVNTVRADFQNCSKLANADTVVAMDDTIFTREQSDNTVGPTLIWSENIGLRIIEEIGRKEYGGHRGMSWGKYNI
jgi:predicted O-methyltransferase YrrM